MIRRVPIWLVTALLTAARAAAQPVGDDSTAVQRLIVPPERIAVELEKVRRGALIQMPRAEFEERLQKARHAASSGDNPPRLTRAFYSAELVDQALANGSAQWTVQHNGAPTLLPLPSLNLALQRVRWDHGPDAILAEFDGASPALLLERPGNAVCFVDWSARGLPGPPGLRFDLRIPACPMTVFELRLPADAWLTMPAGFVGLVTGPQVTETPEKRLWRIQVTGRAQLDFTVRRSSEGGAPPRLHAQWTNRQFLTPDRVHADYEVMIEALSGSPRELVFEGDPLLQPYELSARGATIASWTWQSQADKMPPDAKQPPPPGLLTVRLQEPLQGTLPSLKVRCLAPRAPQGAWSSPGLALRQTVVRGETLRVQIHPDLQPGKWEPGDFRLTGTSTESDNALTLTLVDPQHDIAPSRRPFCALRTEGNDLRTRQHTVWHLAAGSMTLTSEITFDLARGSLHRLAVKLPAAAQGYQVESVEMTPKDQLGSWVNAGSLLLVDLQRGLTPREPATLKVRLWAPEAAAPQRIRTLDFPELEPQDTSLRESSFEIFADPMFQSRLLQSSVRPSVPTDPRPDPDLGLPGFAFSSRGPAITGRLLLVPERPRVRVQTRQEVALDNRGGSWRARLEIEPVIGRSDHFDFTLSSPLGGPLHIRAEGQPTLVGQITRQTTTEIAPHFLALGARSPIDRLVLDACLPVAQVWRVQFSEPLQKKAVLVFEASMPPAPEPEAGDEAEIERVRVIPLLAARDAELAETDLVVHSAERPIVSARAGSLEQTQPPPAARQPAHDWAFRSRDRLDGRASLEVVTRVEEQARSAGAVCARVRITTVVREDRSLLHHLAFDLANWRQPNCPLGLPADVEVLSMRIDGAWLSRPELTERGPHRFVALPLDPEAASQRIDITYATPATPWPWFAVGAVDAIEPVLPAPATSVRRRWLLAPGVLPLSPQTLRAPALPAPLAPATRPSQAWLLGDDWLLTAWPDAAHRQSAEQRQFLLGSESRLRPHLTRETTLGDALERLALQFLLERCPLVIDVDALEGAGLNAQVPLGEAFHADGPFWTARGLECLASPHGAIVTTRARVERWRAVEADAAVLGGRLAPVVDDALRFGSERTGSFVSLPTWLRQPATPVGSLPGAFVLEQQPPGWTEWEAVPGPDVEPSLWIVDTALARLVGWTLAGVALVLALTLASAGRPLSQCRLYGLVLLALTLAVLWLPATLRLGLWPLAVVVAGALVWSFIAFLRTPPVRSHGRSTMIRARPAVPLILLALALPTVAWAQPAGLTWILLIGDDDPQRQTALVPAEFLKRLDELENRTPLGQAGVVVSGARYNVRVKDQTAAVEATFDLYCCRDQAELLLPLRGVQLQEGVFLDGAPAFPVAQKQGYAQPVRGKGNHHLRLTFTVPVTAGEFHDVRFGLPRTPRTQVEVSWATPVRGPQLLAGSGEEQSNGDGKGRVNSLRAQLGAQSFFQVRWLTEGLPAAPGTPEVREAYAWDLDPVTPTLTGVLQYQIARGAVTQLAFGLPEGLEVRGVELTSPGGTGAAAVSVPLRKWQVVGKDAQRQLQVQLAHPAAGALTCTLDILPRLKLATGETWLRLPVPLGAKTADGLVAYRLGGLEAADRTQQLAITSLPADQFAQLWAGLTARPVPAMTRAFSFRRTGNPAALGLNLQSSRPQGEMDCVWHVRARDADLQARVTLRSTADDLMLIETRVPPALTLADVAGPQVHHWNLQDGLLQIWLTQPRKQVTFQLTGWTQHGFDPAAARTGRLVLPTLQLSHVKPAATQIVLVPDKGLSVEAERLVNLTAKRAPLTFVCPDGNYEAAFRLAATAPAPEARYFTMAKARGNEVDLACTAELLGTHDWPTLRLRVADWPGADARLTASVPLLRKEHVLSDGHHVWTLALAPGLPSRLTLTVHGRLRAGPGQTLALPVVSLDAAVSRERWVALQDLELDAAGSAERAEQAQPEPWRFGAEGARAAALWKMTTADARARLRVPIQSSAGQAQIIRAQHDAAYVGPGRWLHQARYLVQRRDLAELRVTLPANARWLTATVDGAFVLPARRAAGELALPLPPDKAACAVGIVWDSPNGANDPAAPSASTAQVVDARALGTSTRFELPADYVRSQPASLADTEASQLLDETRGYVRLSTELADQASALTHAQESYFAVLRHLEIAAAWLAAREESGSDILIRDVAELRQANQLAAATRKYEPVRIKAAGSRLATVTTLTTAAPTAGEPVAWRPGESTEPLTSTAQLRAEERQHLTEVMLLAAVALFVVSYLRVGQALLRFFWPEAIFVAAAGGILVWGLTLPALILLAAALGVRLTWLLRRASVLTTLVRRKPATPRPTDA